jgi:3-methyladenine DNA glycosylase AlkC
MCANKVVIAKSLKLPKAAGTITKGSTLKVLLDTDAVNCLAHNLHLVDSSFNQKAFRKAALSGLANLEILQRGKHIADVLYKYLPSPYTKAISLITKSLTSPLATTEKFGLGVFFYLPHVFFVAKYGLDPAHNAGIDPFDTSMNMQYELTRRFSCEYSIRPYLIQQQERTLSWLYKWSEDDCPHVRRLCSEGSRPRLPWAIRIPSFVKDPSPCLKILDRLKDDPELYVRRSVANHIGDIAKSHPELALRICKSWIKGSSDQRRWLIRHALRYLAKKNDPQALKLRALAK